MPENGIIFYGVKDYPARGGTSRVVENIIRNLTDKYKITLYCYKDPQAPGNIPEVKVIQFPVMPFKSVGVFLYYFFSAAHMLLFMSKHNIVHAHKTDCAFFIPLLRIKFKVIATSHEAPYKRDKWSLFGKLYFHIAERFFIYSGAVLTSISEPLACYYKKKYNRVVTFIPNGININIEYDDAKANALLKNHNINHPFVLFAARRLMATKGCHTMLAALDMIKFKGPILIAGELDHANNYVIGMKKQYKNLDLHFIGYVSPLPLLMSLVRKSQLFIFPSETEGMSIMFLEVISTGANIIASDIPENIQVLGSSEILYFKNKNANDLAEKITFALENKSIMDAYSQKSMEKIRSVFVWDKIANQYDNLYKPLLK